MSDGTYNKFEMIDNIVSCLGAIPVSGSEKVVLMSQAYQMLFALKKGLEQEDKAKNMKIETLKEQLKRATELIPDDEEGTVIGGEHYEFHYGGAEDGKN